MGTTEAMVALVILLVILVALFAGFVVAMRWVFRRPSLRPGRARREGENSYLGAVLSMVDGLWTRRGDRGRSDQDQKIGGGGTRS
jgi:uncharacterized membrane protein YgcG